MRGDQWRRFSMFVRHEMERPVRPNQFHLFRCEEGEKWEDAQDPANMNCVPICTYPEEFYDYGMSLGKVSPLSLGQTLCWLMVQKRVLTSNLFIVTIIQMKSRLLLWLLRLRCGYCPDYVQMVNSNAGAIKTGGAYHLRCCPRSRPFSGVPRRGPNYINSYIGADNNAHPGLRVGDGTTRWQYDDGKVSEEKAGGVYASPDISGIPSAFVIRKDTMEVIESRGLSQYTLNLVNILSDLRSGAYDTE